MYVDARFHLDPVVCWEIEGMTPQFGFNGVGEVVYRRTYSRRYWSTLLQAERQEDWPQTVIRVTNGVFSIRKDWYTKHGIHWDEDAWQAYAERFAKALFRMTFLPPGRGLWVMGSDYLYERGSMALYNCAYTEITKLSRDADWMTDVLMCGVGAGFNTRPAYEIRLQTPSPLVTHYQVPDSREGWVESVRRLIESYEKGSRTVVFDYSLIRKAGEPIKGFGGTASGYEPLAKLHGRLRGFCEAFIAQDDPAYTSTRLIADVMNAIGACVVAGNVRRSAQIALGAVDDPVFRDLKNWEVNPERGPWMNMSNNSVVLETDADFDRLPQIARRIVDNGEPGFLNMVNIRQFGRLYDREGLRADNATGCNPCGEIPLADKEVCNLSEVFPLRCVDDAELFDAMRFATFYASTVSLLPTHRPETNKVVARNRRIGVSISGVTAWLARETQPGRNGMSSIVRVMREGYKIVRQTNQTLADEAGVPPAIRVTTVKPSGSISLLAGQPSGVHNPEFDYWAKNMRIGVDNVAIQAVLNAAGVPHWEAAREDRTLIYRFPMTRGTSDVSTGQTIVPPTVLEVSIEQQYMLVEAMYRHWADNMVSVTLKFKKSRIDPRIAFYYPAITAPPIHRDAGGVETFVDPVVEAAYLAYVEQVIAGDARKIEAFLGKAAGNLKSAALMPIFDIELNEDGSMSDEALKAYQDLPEEPLSRLQYEELLASIKPFDWGGFVGDGEDQRFCDTGACEIPAPA